MLGFVSYWAAGNDVGVLLAYCPLLGVGTTKHSRCMHASKGCKVACGGCLS